MFKIYDGSSAFCQWEIDQKLLVNASCNEVHFTNDGVKTLELIPYELGGQIVVDVPNILLQENKPITVYAYVFTSESSFTKVQKTFMVVPYAKPDDYEYTETEVAGTRSLPGYNLVEEDVKVEDADDGFQLIDGRSTFYQWDVGQKLIVNVECNEIHFSNDGSRALVFLPYEEDTESLVEASYESDGVRLVNVPNTLLQEEKPITVYAYVYGDGSSYTKVQKTFVVVPRAKPDDYAYTEDEVLTFSTLLEEAKNSGMFDGPPGPAGPQGAVGPAGPAGNPFRYEDFTPEQLEALRGPEGPKGDPGKDFKYEYFTPEQLYALTGPQGVPGPQGPTGPAGAQGQPGERGPQGDPGKDGYTPVKGIDYFDGKDGKDGSNGKDGAAGYTPVKGVDYFDGNPGKDGADGADGYSPTVAVADIAGGHRVTITDKDGANAFDVMDGKDGQGGGGGTTVQADMAQNDPTQADYVKNRTHWSEGVKDIPIQGLWDESAGLFAFSAPLGLELGKRYIVTWDGVECEGVAHEGAYNGVPCACLGNTPLFFGTGDNGQPFVLAEFPAEAGEAFGTYGAIGATDLTLGHEFSIKQETVHKLDNKFIDAEWMAKSTEETVLLPRTTLTPTGGSTGLADPSTGVITRFYNLADAEGANILTDKVPAASNTYILADGRKYYGTFYSQTIDGELMGTVYMFDTHLGVMVTHWISGSGSGSGAGAYCFIMAKEARDYTVSVGVGGKVVPLPEKYIPDNLKALIGTTDEITPAQVAEAVEAGRPIALTHTDATFGNLVFTAFAYAKTLGVVQASGIFYSYEQYVAAVLGGGVAGGGWNVIIEALAPVSSVPTVQDIIDALPIYNGEVEPV